MNSIPLASPFPALLLAIICFASPAFSASDSADSPREWTLVPGSRLWLEGDSTLHGYHAQSSGFFVVATVPGNMPRTPSPEQLVSAAHGISVSVRVPVRSLKSGEGGLDTNLWKTLGADRTPLILFHLTTLKPNPGAQPNGWLAEGTLSVSGAERTVSLPLVIVSEARGLHITGVQELRMSSFNLKAPVLFAGAIKTDDRVTVHLDLILQPTAG